MRLIQLHVGIKSNTHRFLKKQSKTIGVSIGGIIRSLIEEYQKHNEPAAEAQAAKNNQRAGEPGPK